MKTVWIQAKADKHISIAQNDGTCGGQTACRKTQ